MKSGGPWNLRGLRPESREAAREAARRSGMSVGEWLNSVIQPGDDDYDEPVRFAEFDDEDEDDWRREHRREPRPESRRSAGRRRERDRDPEREAAFAREEFRESARIRGEIREATRAREEFGEVHSRLDKLSRQLERMARIEAAIERNALPQNPPPQASREPGYEQREPAYERRQPSYEPREPAYERRQPGYEIRQPDYETREPGYERNPPLSGAPQPPHRTMPAAASGPSPQADRPIASRRAAPSNGAVSVDAAVAEIAERQRALYGQVPAAPVRAPVAPPVYAAPLPPPPPPPAVLPVAAPGPAYDLGNLEQQLRQITARIETLRPGSDLETAVSAVRTELAQIATQLTEALPRRAVESLEIEVKALAQRIDHSRQCGVDTTALAGLERGLTEVRESLRGLTTAEKLVGFDEAVKALAQKVDQIAAKDDPAALQQLETAIGALRGIVSHVASNDTLTKVAEDIRALAAKVDTLANSAASANALAALESRIDALAGALTASTEAGQAIPRELEKLLGGLIEKLEWVQLTHTDHAALGHLEDRIATLVKRFDASDAALGHLEAVERGIADLLVHIEDIRGIAAKPAAAVMPKAADAEVIGRAVAEIKQSERRTQDSLEAVHDTVDHVVDRLAMIESGLHQDAVPTPAAFTAPAEHPVVEAAEPAVEEPLTPPEPMPAPAPPVAAPVLAEAASRRAAAARPPLDPNLPPDHPLEPGSAPGPTRIVPSAADRIAASEAALGSAKPPAAPEPEAKPNFILAARRAAQTAASAPPEKKSRSAVAPRATATVADAAPGGLSQRLRKLLVAGAVVLIAVGGLRIATHMFEDRSAATAPQPEQATPPAALPKSDAAKEAAPEQSAPLPPLPLPAAPGPNGSLNITPDVPAAAQQPGTATETTPGKQSALPLWAAPDITGSLPRRVAPSSVAPLSATESVEEKLPATIGGPALRAAAMAGDAAAAYEVATRFAEGRGVPQSNEVAARWLYRAAKQGLAPAQFRLGSFYEKGVGVKKDLAAARDFYLAAADKGNGKAMHNLAVLYAEGINGPADYRAAAHWFRKAADHGITDSQFNLAILYARGTGVEQNYAESYKWFVLAAANGDADAAKKRDEVGSHLDKQSLAAARLAAQTWTAEAQPEDATSVTAPAGGWDAAASATPVAKPKPRQSSIKPASPETKI